MALATVIQLIAACIGIVGSLFFAIGVIRQNAQAMARLSSSYFDANPHMPAALASQRAEYIFGGALIVAAFALHYLFEGPARTWIRRRADRLWPAPGSRAAMAPGSQPPDV